MSNAILIELTERINNVYKICTAKITKDLIII